MFSNLTLKGLYDKRWFILGWTFGLIGMAALTIAFFPAIGKTPAFDKLLANAPKQLQGVIGDVSSYNHINGYLASGIYELRIPMLAIPMAIILAIGLGVGEESGGRLDQLLAQPISRTRIILEKWLTFLAVILSTMAMLGVGIALAILAIHEHVSFSQQFELLSMTTLLAITIGAITMMVGALRGNKGLTTLVVTAIAFGSYLITSFATQVSWLKNVDYVSLFHYYHPALIIKTGISSSHVLVFLVITVVSIIVAVIGFNSRDINV